MDMNVKHIDFDACTSVVKEHMQVSLSDSGKLLCLSICLKNIWSDRPLVVGVLIYYNDRPYALQIKEVNGCECARCCCCCLKDICVEGFEFILPDQIGMEQITIKAIAHYIC